MAKANAQTVEENRAETAAPEAEGSKGVRARRAIMMKEFVPNADFIAKECVGKGKGTQCMLGRVFGFVTGVAEKQGTLPNGDKSISIVCNGQFETENYITGEVSSASSVYFPSSFSEQIKAMFASDENLKVVEVDTDIGVEATGKTIPYTWMVVNHIEGEAVTPLKKLRAARGRPASAPALTAPAKVAQIENKS
jgi:hypothetical protein